MNMYMNQGTESPSLATSITTRETECIIGGCFLEETV